MYAVFDLRDEKTRESTEYEIDIPCVPRVGEIIFLHDRKVEKSLNGEFHVQTIKYEIIQNDLEEDQQVGKGVFKYVRVTASKV